MIINIFWVNLFTFIFGIQFYSMCDLNHHIKFHSWSFIHMYISCGTNSWTNSCLLPAPNKMQSSIAQSTDSLLFELSWKCNVGIIYVFGEVQLGISNEFEWYEGLVHNKRLFIFLKWVDQKLELKIAWYSYFFNNDLCGAK